MKAIQITKRAAGHYTATTPAGTYTIDRIGRTWHLNGHRVALTFRTMRAAVATTQTLRPTSPAGSIPTRLAKVRRRSVAAARTAIKAVFYRCLSGDIAVAVDQGHLVRTGDLLDRLGADDLKDGQRSWYGRHTAKAYRAMNLGADAIKVWAQHRTTGKWIHVHVYKPTDPALYVALTTYKATRHLVQADFLEAA